MGGHVEGVDLQLLLGRGEEGERGGERRGGEGGGGRKGKREGRRVEMEESENV